MTLGSHIHPYVAGFPKKLRRLFSKHGIPMHLSATYSTVLRSLPSCLNPHSRLASGGLNRSHNRVGQGFAVVSPLTPGDCNDPCLLFHTLVYVVTHMISSGSMTLSITSKETTPTWGFVPGALHHSLFKTEEACWVTSETSSKT